ncbi:MAG TPA: histidine--tRNA ligase, partial [Candidatus Dormibacteraeota bacterium]|nr:histidine--tRNA ligase [Candidatus Dormibacteraeota bacterium]
MSEAAKPENERRKFRAIKGTRDILPPDSALWNWFEKTARGVMEAYNFGEIRTPIFEETELFARSIGGETDVVSKEMYTFADHSLSHLEWMRNTILVRRSSHDDPIDVNILIQLVDSFVSHAEAATSEGEMPKTSDNARALDRLRALSDRTATFLVPQTAAMGKEEFELYANQIRAAVGALKFGDLITLRPEATASVVRAYIEHGMHTRPGDQKLYYIGPMFRRERPQKGRYRQFYQIGAEVLGTSDAPAIDAELIQMLTDLLERCQIEKYTLLINSIGCPDTPERKGCRPKYVELLRAKLREPEIFSKLGADSQRRVETNPLRVMDSKLPEEQAIIEKLPKISEHLCADCREHYEKLKKELKLREVPFTESPRLVRGLDYYMRTTFEITSPIL